MKPMRGWVWLGALLAGPTVWAVVFTGVYMLHGLGCSRGWPAVSLGPVSLHWGAMALVWVAGLATCGALLVWARPVRADAAQSGGNPAVTLEARLVRIGLWIGFGATLFSLAPLLVASSC